jgi:hypothetical protein
LRKWGEPQLRLKKKLLAVGSREGEAAKGPFQKVRLKEDHFGLFAV